MAKRSTEELSNSSVAKRHATDAVDASAPEDLPTRQALLEGLLNLAHLQPLCRNVLNLVVQHVPRNVVLEHVTPPQARLEPRHVALWNNIIYSNIDPDSPWQVTAVNNGHRIDLQLYHNAKRTATIELLDLYIHLDLQLMTLNNTVYSGYTYEIRRLIVYCNEEFLVFFLYHGGLFDWIWTFRLRNVNERAYKLILHPTDPPVCPTQVALWHHWFMVGSNCYDVPSLEPTAWPHQKMHRDGAWQQLVVHNSKLYTAMPKNASEVEHRQVCYRVFVLDQQ